MYGSCYFSVGSCWSRTLQTPCHLWAFVHASPSFWSTLLSPTSPQLIPYTVQVSFRKPPWSPRVGGGPVLSFHSSWGFSHPSLDPSVCLSPIPPWPAVMSASLRLSHLWTINPWAWGQSPSWLPHYLQSLAHSEYTALINDTWDVGRAHFTTGLWSQPRRPHSDGPATSTASPAASTPAGRAVAMPWIASAFCRIALPTCLWATL